MIGGWIFGANMPSTTESLYGVEESTGSPMGMFFGGLLGTTGSIALLVATIACGVRLGSRD